MTNKMLEGSAAAIAKRKQLQKLIDHINSESRKASELAKVIFGRDAQLFLEAGGSLYVMSGDSDGTVRERRDFIEMTAKGQNPTGIGAC